MRWRDQTSVVKCKQAALWHVCSLVLFRCLAYSDPLQTLGLSCSLSPAHTTSCSIILSLSWAARTDTLLLDSFIPLSSICKLFFFLSFFCFWLNSLFPLLCSFTACPLLVTVTSLPVLPLCISVSGLACLVMMRFDPPCWMILTWYPTSGWFLSRLTSLS